ncbi:MAG: hypothetical protein CM15mP74_18610 [Halieaceae bacterium]|nr:MAG: hypothetical protein CM15mP74_18610 [Halieaceae bacterium]
MDTLANMSPSTTPHTFHESAWLYGKVYVGPGASIWPNVSPGPRPSRSDWCTH